MRKRVLLKGIASFSKGVQINGEDLIEDGAFPYLNGGIQPSGRWSACNTPGNTITISEGGNSCGFVNLMTEPFWCGAHCYYLYDLSVDVQYLYFALKSQQERIMGIRSGACMPNIKKNDLGCFELTIHTEDAEQKHIVEQLLLCQTVIEHRQWQLRVLDTLIKAQFVEMFGDPVSNLKKWPVRPLLDMGDCKNGMNFHYDDSGVELHCLGVGDFQNHSIIADTSTLSMVSLNELPSDEYMLRDDDIVFVRSNGNKALVGRCVAVYPGNVPTTFSGFCIRYRKRDEGVTIPYLLRVLKTDSMRTKMAGRGANIQNLNQQILRTLIIPVPPLALQEQFSTFVSQIDKSKSVVQKALDEAQLLFDSLMQQYFG